MRDQRDQRIVTLGHRLENIVAADYTKGLRQLETERVMAATGPAKGETSGVRGSGSTSATERNACEMERLGMIIEELRDARDGAEVAINLLARLAMEATRTRAFSAPIDEEGETPMLCRDQQFGKAGVIEWGDPLCLRLGAKAGLCGRHYMAWYRYRVNNGINTDNDFEVGAA